MVEPTPTGQTIFPLPAFTVSFRVLKPMVKDTHIVVKVNIGEDILKLSQRAPLRTQYIACYLLQMIEQSRKKVLRINTP